MKSRNISFTGILGLIIAAACLIGAILLFEGSTAHGGVGIYMTQTAIDTPLSTVN